MINCKFGDKKYFLGHSKIIAIRCVFTVCMLYVVVAVKRASDLFYCLE